MICTLTWQSIYQIYRHGLSIMKIFAWCWLFSSTCHLYASNIIILLVSGIILWWRCGYCRYVTSDDVVELKGKVACEISSADELTLTELMFNGVLKDIKVEEMVSLLSCFVWQEKLNDAPKPREELDLLFTQLQDTARRVAKVQLECKVLWNLISVSFFFVFLYRY